MYIGKKKHRKLLRLPPEVRQVKIEIMRFCSSAFTKKLTPYRLKELRDVLDWMTPRQLRIASAYGWDRGLVHFSANDHPYVKSF